MGVHSEASQALTDKSHRSKPGSGLHWGDCTGVQVLRLFPPQLWGGHIPMAGREGGAAAEGLLSEGRPGIAGKYALWGCEGPASLIHRWIGRVLSPPEGGQSCVRGRYFLSSACLSRVLKCRTSVSRGVGKATDHRAEAAPPLPAKLELKEIGPGLLPCCPAWHIGRLLLASPAAGFSPTQQPPALLLHWVEQ